MIGFPCMYSICAEYYQLQQVMSTSVSVSVVFVWGVVCLAYWRYYLWNKKHQKHLDGPRYGRYSRQKYSGLGVPTFLARLQPGIAIFGFIGCFLIVYIFTTAVWWTGKPQPKDVVAYYAVVSKLHWQAYRRPTNVYSLSSFSCAGSASR